MMFNYKKGSIVTLVLVFGFISLLLLGSLFNFMVSYLKTTNQKIAWHQSLYIAESGLEYYKWCLNNGVEEDCQLEKEYFDNSGNLIGHFEIETTPIFSCGETIERSIISTGWTENFPQIQRKIKVLYARESTAKYTFLLNSNVWVGADTEVRGIYHSNGGIRMDGENQSLVSSSRSNWLCTPSFGCDPCPENCTEENGSCLCPGVFTTTKNAREDLFHSPSDFFDFEGITIDLAQMKSISQSGGRYLSPSSDTNSLGKGYRINLKEDGTAEIWIITKLSEIWAYDLERDWHLEESIIENEYLHETIVLDTSCPLIFIEDNIWIEGKIRDKVTIASADLISPNKTTSLYLLDGLEYDKKDEDGLTLISQENVLIAPNAPDKLELKGIFIAQEGYFGIKHYPDNIKEKLEIIGSVISNGRVGTQWISGSQIVSGYQRREIHANTNLIYSPPPFTPYTSPEFDIIRWEEIK